MVGKSLHLARIAGLALLALVLWIAALVAFVAVGDDEIPIAGNDVASLVDAAKKQAAEHRGNLALVVINSGRIAGSHFHSIGRPVDRIHPIVTAEFAP